MAASNPISAFLQAAFDGNLTRLKRFALEIGNGRELAKIVDVFGCNALHCAAASGKTQMCKFLIEDWKFDIDSREGKGNTPLIAAIQKQKHSAAVYLIENGAKIDCPNDGGFTALHWAAITGQMEILHLLLSKGAKAVNELSKFKIFTPLQYACWHGREEAVKLLLDYSADPNATLELVFTPLMISVDVGSFECMELLLKAGADPSLGSAGTAPLILAAFKGDPRIIKRLLKAGANPDVTDICRLLTPIQHAALCSNVDAVKALFPFTSQISCIPDWSVSGIMKYASSKETMEQMLIRKTDYFEKSKANGREAFERKDYYAALHWFSEADLVDPIQKEVLSNRSLCWLKLNQGRNALNDAKACVELDPKWQKGHYREGAAQMLLHDYSKAAEAFAKALRLAPKNMDIKKAHREAVEAELAARMVDHLFL